MRIKLCVLEFEFSPLNAGLNPICYLLALLGAHHFLHVSRIRVKSLILRLLISYIYKTKLRGLSPRANYTDRAAAAGRRSWCQLLRVEGCHVVSATGPHGR